MFLKLIFPIRTQINFDQSLESLGRNAQQDKDNREDGADADGLGREGSDYEAGSVEMAIIMRIAAMMRTVAIIKA